MPTQANPDELDLVDLHLEINVVEELFGTDKVWTEEEVTTLDRLRATARSFAIRIKARNALEAVLKNGRSRYIDSKVEDAGIAFVMAPEGYVTNVIEFATVDAPQQVAV